MQRFGEKIRALRKFHHVTLKWVAKQTEYKTHSYISEVECGQKMPSVLFVLKIATLFHVTTDQLLKDELDIDFKHSYIENTESKNDS